MSEPTIEWERRKGTYQANGGRNHRLGVGMSPLGRFWSIYSFTKQRNVAGGEAKTVKQAKRFAEVMWREMEAANA